MKIVHMKTADIIVDDDDYERVNRHKWNFNSNGYPRRTLYLKEDDKTHTLLLHRDIMKAPKGTYIDHINGNKLDCRKSNLRFCTFSQNLANRSARSDNTHGFKGISYDKRRGLWRARITVDYKEKWLGYFKTTEEAQKAYAKAANLYFGEFARIA